jgi:hypothetical protein
MLSDMAMSIFWHQQCIIHCTLTQAVHCFDKLNTLSTIQTPIYCITQTKYILQLFYDWRHLQLQSPISRYMILKNKVFTTVYFLFQTSTNATVILVEMEAPVLIPWISTSAVVPWDTWELFVKKVSRAYLISAIQCDVT